MIIMILRRDSLLAERAFKAFSISRFLVVRLDTDACKELLRAFDEKNIFLGTDQKAIELLRCGSFLVPFLRCVLK